MNKRIFLIVILFWAYVCGSLQAQKDKVKIVTVGFYNLENLFDTVDDTLIQDEEFLPSGSRSWTEEKYQEKLTNMAYVISQIGIQDVKSGLSFLGVAEIENRKVLEDLVKQPSLAARNYKIIHYDSPDGRGVDVAFLYNPGHFKPMYSKAIPLLNYENGERKKTRDVLYVKGLMEEDTMHVLVNHWPSRGGGPLSETFRINGAILCRQVVDSLFAQDAEAKIFILGDLNDDPTDKSLKNHLKTVGNIKDVKKTGLFNPFEDFFRRGQGSNAFNDAWSLFDQIIISRGIASKKSSGFRYFKANIFNKKFLIQSTGRYKGYPFRTFSGDTYQAGYSDHYPTYLYLVKKE